MKLYFIVTLLLFAIVVDIANAKIIIEPSHSDAACYNFSVGNPELKEIYSPNYPNLYPEQSYCSHTIIADPGHVVVLEFQDPFLLEKSPMCRSVRVKVIDGPNRSFPLLGTFCGHQVPPPLVSSGRYMRVIFESDVRGFVNYGFRAAYKFVKMANQDRPSDRCRDSEDDGRDETF